MFLKPFFAPFLSYVICTLIGKLIHFLCLINFRLDFGIRWRQKQHENYIIKVQNQIIVCKKHCKKFLTVANSNSICDEKDAIVFYFSFLTTYLSQTKFSHWTNNILLSFSAFTFQETPFYLALNFPFLAFLWTNLTSNKMKIWFQSKSLRYIKSLLSLVWCSFLFF